MIASGLIAAASVCAASRSASGRGLGRTRRPEARGRADRQGWQRRADDVGRQRQVDGAGRRAARNRERAVDHRLELIAPPQLVVPLHELAHQAALVERLLGPVDALAARGRQSAFGDGGPAGQHQHRDPGARGVDHPAERVGGPGQRVHHHRLGSARDHRVAVGHRHRRDLVGHGDRPQAAGPAQGLPFGERFDDRGKVGAGAAPEETADAAGLQELEQPLGHSLDVQTMSRHGRVGLQLVIPLDLPAQRDRVRHVDDESVVPVLPHPTIPAHLPGTR